MVQSDINKLKDNLKGNKYDLCYIAAAVCGGPHVYSCLVFAAKLFLCESTQSSIREAVELGEF